MQCDTLPSISFDGSSALFKTMTIPSASAIVTVGARWLDPDRTADLPLPSYETEGSAGMDICAAVERDYLLQPGQRALIPTGLAVSVPSGYELQVRPRSGLAIRHGITLINSPGTIDSDYRGEIKIALINLGENVFPIHRGDRIAQLVLAPVAAAHLRLLDSLDETSRGAGGFGHTGTR